MQKRPPDHLNLNIPKKLDFRKIINSQYHLTQINFLSKKWGNIKAADVCWRLIVEGIERERKLRDGEKE